VRTLFRQLFSSYMYKVKAAERRLYKKFVGLTLMKLTPAPTSVTVTFTVTTIWFSTQILKREIWNFLLTQLHHRRNKWHTVKLVYNDHPWDPKFVAVVDWWSLFRGSFMLWKLKLRSQNCGRCRQAVVIWRWSLTQVWLYAYFFT